MSIAQVHTDLHGYRRLEAIGPGRAVARPPFGPRGLLLSLARLVLSPHSPVKALNITSAKRVTIWNAENRLYVYG